MRTNALRVAVVGIGLLWATGTAHAAEGISWVKSLSTAKVEAKKSDKMIMVDFYTDWCGWCKKLDSDTYTDKQVVQLAGQLIPVKLDAEDKGEGQAAAKKYKVGGYPTILFLNAEGDVEGKIGGYEPPTPFAAQMKQAIQTHKEFPALLQRYKKDPNDAEATAKLASIYAGQGKTDKAAAMLAEAEKSDPKNEKGFLGKAYNAVADMYQENEQFDKAIPLFKNAVKTGKQPYDIAYAHLSIATCYALEKKFDEALPEAEATIAVPDCPKDLKEQAQQMLMQLKQAQKGGK